MFPAWPPQWPEIAESVAESIASGNWGRYQGPAAVELADQLCQLTASKRCRLTSSGSVAVELALRSVGVLPGDQVICCGYDYPGNFRAIELLGARPLLVDADPAGFSIDPGQLDEVSDSRVRAVLVSHLYGIPAQIASIRSLCDRRGWKLVEDACQVPGMWVDGRPAAAWGDVGVYSFGGSKPLTAGTGGALLTNDDSVASKWNVLLDRPSNAMPLSELQAAALLPQLLRLEQCNQIRHETTQFLLNAVDWLRDAVGDLQPVCGATCYKLAANVNAAPGSVPAGVPGSVPAGAPGSVPGRDHAGAPGSVPGRDHLLAMLVARGLPVGAGYRSMHRSSDRRCGKVGQLGRCRILGEQLCLFDHSMLLATGEQRERLAAALKLPQ
ncbi:DegT/DnrJ/EryC1/StrS family aminotransferase [Stieleria tagensis]|uniref:DegT/DnrJ/EryC1/StrS family aminotransferase n=1 Tax=Stieleria tagensis TaxID=2956795 RepID=UPI00209BA142|nr:DegT/DnrJ/EryC1/StrS family aminotransferase [Stieleria tagensis]